MKLETLLKPIKYFDENVILRQYTKLGKKINIDEGKRKYDVGFFLWCLYSGLSLVSESHTRLFDKNFAISSILITAPNDGYYNCYGGLVGDKDSTTSDFIALDPIKEKHRKYNSFVRLPTFLFGAVLIAKFGIDLANNITNQTSLEAPSYYCLFDGIGHLSLASSMYLKETDTKLLDKVPLWKQALEYIKEKASLIGQQPVPVPVYNSVRDQ
jgi:hypothetical protein